MEQEICTNKKKTTRRKKTTTTVIETEVPVIEESTPVEDNETVAPTVADNKVSAKSCLYMIIYYAVYALIIASMILHFIAIQNLIGEFPVGKVPYDTIISLNEALPYENLIYALMLYCLGLFGIEGTRSLIMSLDLNDIGKQSKNMPAYKRRRLLQMLITFILASILGLIFQVKCTECVKATFHLDSFYIGIAIFLSLLAYSDFSPKLGKNISVHIANKRKREEESCQK